jgi:hypothetical protein
MKLKIEVEVSEGFMDWKLRRNIYGVKPMTSDEKLDAITKTYTSQLKRDMAEYAVKEAKELADAQIKEAKEQALAQAEQLVVITKDENTSN